jgi:hypothetical protein
MNFQMSGEVSDDSMQALGRMLGAQSIVTGSLRNIENGYRIMIRVLNVESAAVEVQYRSDIVNDNRVASLMTGGRSGGTSAVVSTTSDEISGRQTITIPNAVIPQGNTLNQQLAWIASQAGDGTVYDILINNDVNLGPVTVSTRGRNITITIRSSNPVDIKTLQLIGQGHLFTVDASVTLIFQDIILKGHNTNNRALILVGERGRLILNSGSTIMSNTNNSPSSDWRNAEADGGGIYVNGGFFEMNEGSEISGNRIVSNTYAFGGGISVENGGSASILGGIISENNITGTNAGYVCGAGISIRNRSTVTMSGGVIQKNSISAGHAQLGGGVFVDIGQNARFDKRSIHGSNTSGIIYGSTGENANRAPGGGHTVTRYPSNSRNRNTTLGYFDEISTSSNEGWNQ